MNRKIVIILLCDFERTAYSGRLKTNKAIDQIEDDEIIVVKDRSGKNTIISVLIYFNTIDIRTQNLFRAYCSTFSKVIRYKYLLDRLNEKYCDLMFLISYKYYYQTLLSH